MESALASASAITDQRQKIEQYKHILSSVIASNDIVQAKKFIDHSYLSPSLSIFLIKNFRLGFFEIHYFGRKQTFVRPYFLSLNFFSVQCYPMMCHWLFRVSCCRLLLKSWGDQNRRRKRKLPIIPSLRFNLVLSPSKNRLALDYIYIQAIAI